MDLPKNAAEWLALPELEIPVVTQRGNTGRVYEVQRGAFVAATLSDCVEHGLSLAINPFGYCPLPMCTIADNLYRLPLALSGWAEECAALIRAVKTLFPRRVDFGLLYDRHYAEIL